MLGNRHVARGSRVPARVWLAALVALSLLALLVPAQPASSQVAVDRLRPGPIADAADPREVRTERLAIERVDGVSAAEVEAAAGVPAEGAEAAERGSGEDAGVAAKEAPRDDDAPRRTGGGYELLELGEPMTLAEAEALAERLVRDGVATVAVPEYPMDIAWAIDDTDYPDQWHLHGEPSPWPGVGSDTYGIRVEDAWSETAGSSDVVVAVLDTGVTPHADLVDRLVPGYDFIDDVPGGWDPGNYRLEGQCGGASKKDSDWHGLHVAGTIGATTDNGSGVAGVDQRARILPVRVLGPCGGSNFTVVDGIYWAAGAGTAHLPGGVPVNPTPADVINLSLGSPTPAVCDKASQAAIDYAVSNGITVVVAAGNSGGQASSYAPANCENVITVAATSPIGDRAYYTNTGPAVDIAAPGGDASFTAYGTVLSLSDSGEQGPEGDTVGWKQGTSMAAPHVAGVVALMLSIDDTLSPADVAQVLRSTAQRFPTDTGYPEYVCTTGSSASSCGAGIVDAAQAVDALLYPPAVPAGLKATASVGQVKATWKASPGATRYQLFRRTSPCTNSSKGTKVYDGSSRSFTDKNLKAGVTYHYCVRAWNRVGASALSSAKAATPKAATVVPAAPSWGSSASLRFDLASSGVRLTWPAANGTVSHYQIQRGTTTVATTTSRSQTVTGLSTGRRTTLRVRAVNSGGASAWLSVAVTPTSGFRDVGSSNSFRQDVRWLATAEITRGCNPPANDRFCPGSVVTREQMAAFLVRALGLTETSSRGSFRDVPSSNAFRADINRLATAGITMGCNPPANTRFCPGSPVTREQMAAFLTRALELRSTSSEGNFRDVPSSNAFRGDINRLATAGITMGCNPPSNSRFCPKSHVTREQMAAFMRRALATG